MRFLICTDVAARGLDIKELPCVINMTLPDKEEDYIHRVGRVGRAEVVGLAVSLVASGHREKVWYYDRRKWEGRPLSTKLAELGGCCIWYDEPALLRGVQKRLGGGEVETLDAFLALLDFSQLSFDEALRFFLSLFRLPGEAQQIDRIMQKFADRCAALRLDAPRMPRARTRRPTCRRPQQRSGAARPALIMAARPPQVYGAPPEDVCLGGHGVRCPPLAAAASPSCRACLPALPRLPGRLPASPCSAPPP